MTFLNSSLPNSFELWFKWKNLSYNAYTVQMFVCCQLLASLSRLLLWKQLLVKYLWSKLRTKQGKCTYQNNLFVLLQPVFRDYDCQIVIPAVDFETDYIWMPFSTYATRVKMLFFYNHQSQNKAETIYLLSFFIILQFFLFTLSVKQST